MDAMDEPLFFKHRPGLTVGEIAALTGAVPRAGARLDHVIGNIAPLDRATRLDLTFLDTAKYADALTTSRAGACLTTERFEGRAPRDLNVLCTAQPYRAFVTVARKLFPDALRPSSLFEATGMAPGAVIHSSARIESGVRPCRLQDRAARRHQRAGLACARGLAGREPTAGLGRGGGADGDTQRGPAPGA